MRKTHQGTNLQPTPFAKTPSISAAILQPTSSRELIHLGQFAADKKPRKFNFNTPDENLKVYGSIEPPIYDLSRIRLQKMSFYAGVSDTLVSPDDVRVTLSQLAGELIFR